MEKTILLEELAKLERIIKNHESLRGDGRVASHKRVDLLENKSSNSRPKGKIAQDQASEKNKNTIFVNPRKLNAFPPKHQLRTSTTLSQHSLLDNDVKTNLAKVYLNPNFKKSNTVPSCQNHIQKPNNELSKYMVKSIEVSKSNALFKEPSIKNQNHKHPGDLWKLGHSKQLPEQSSLEAKYNRSIFINPEFSPATSESNSEPSPSHISVNPTVYTKKETVLQEMVNPNPSSMCLSKTSHDTIPNISTPEYDPKANLLIKRNIYWNKSTLGSYNSSKRRKSVESKMSPGKKIFFNPKFEGTNDLLRNKTNKGIPTMCTVLQKQPSMAAIQGRCKGVTAKTDSILDNCFKGNTKKLVRLRSSPGNTGLVSVSATKLIRKRKYSKSLETDVEITSNKPVFISKTKLVRLSPSKTVKNSTVNKIKVKRAVSKAHLQCLTPDQLSRIRKQSFSNSITNLISAGPSSSAVVKIRSKNGKSLKLVRNNVESCKFPQAVNKIKSMNIIQKRKQILKQQAIKKRLELKKNPFSKINLPVSKRSSYYLDHNKYVFKNKATHSSKPLLKTAVLNKRYKLVNPKEQLSNKTTEKSKVIQSKYRLVRKQSSSCDVGRDKFFKRNSPTKRKWKLQRNSIKRDDKGKERSIVNIGGVFYRCSRTSLTRNKQSQKTVFQKHSKGPLLHIHGQKFQLDKNGLTLTCLDKKPGRKRIDIGGVTFISSSSGTSLTRTNYHTARSILVQAKQRSILLLTRKLKKNNEPCLFFHRFGKCSGKERGTCVRQHDPKYVAVCKKFVQGSCADIQCTLSHTISCHNMPTCQHFLAGQCGRDSCPYPHIKVSDSAPLCLDFLKGFCSFGGQCAKRHLDICPSFEKGTCARGKYCPYPHPKSRLSKQLTKKLKPLKNFDQVSSSNRYFEDLNLQKENEIKLTDGPDEIEEDCSSEEDEERSHPLKNRPRLGSLPSFIPLSLGNSCVDTEGHET